MVLVAMGGGALLSFGFGKMRERRRFLRLKQQPANGRTAPVSPAYKEGGGGRSIFPNKETTHDLSHDAAFNACRSGRARRIRSEIRRNLGRACPCPVLGLAQQRSAPCMAKARGANGRTAPVSPAYKEGGGGRSIFPNKETTHDLSHDAAFNACRSGRARRIRSEIRRNLGRACPCPVLGLAQQRSAPCMAKARGLLSVY